MEHVVAEKKNIGWKRRVFFGRRTSFFPHAPYVYLLLVWIIFAHPYFFFGRVPFPSTYQVNHFHPWSLDPKYWGPVKNGAMPDIIDQIYPWRHFSIQEWKKGNIPLWNPNNFAGNPHIGNMQSAAFSPFNVLFFFLPFIDAWSILVLLQPLIAGISMYLLLRSYALSKRGALVGSVAWMFAGFIVVWMAYATLAMAAAILPLLLFCLRQYLLSSKLKWGIFASLVVAFSFFAGHFQTSLYVLFGGVGYIIFRFITDRKIGKVVGGFVFLLLGLLVSLVQIIPTIELYNLSVRSSSFVSSGGIPIHYLITLIAPDFFGNPVTRNDWFGYYAEWSSFVGIVPLFLAFLTIERKKAQDISFYHLLLSFSLLFTLDSSLQKWLGSLHIPVISTSTPARMIVLASFSLCVLAGFGFDILVKKLKNESLKSLLSRLTFFTVFFIFIWFILFSGNFFSAEQRYIAIRNFLFPTLLFVVLSFSLVMAYLQRKKDHIFLFLLTLIIILCSIDSVRFATKWVPFDPKELVFPDLPVVQKMQETIGSGRVYGNLGAQVSTYYNLPELAGYDPLYIKRYGEFVNTSVNGSYVPAERSVVRINPKAKYIHRLLDILGVSIIYHPNADTKQEWAFPVWNDPRFVQIYKDEYNSLYKNTTAIERPSLFYQYEVISDPQKLLLRFYADDFDFRNVLLLEESPKFPSEKSEKRGILRVLRNDPTYLAFEVISPKQGLLFLADNYYPGWKAMVNGKEVKIYRANYTFRAVNVPKGKSIVEFIYRFIL